jgi:hypothetical protein
MPDTVSRVLLTFEKQFPIPLNDPVDLQFFPEGGRLVNGLMSKVAFKAIGTDGSGREVPGQIKDEGVEAKIEFFTSDRQTSLEVIINGIETGSRNPGQGQVQINSSLK